MERHSHPRVHLVMNQQELDRIVKISRPPEPPSIGMAIGNFTGTDIFLDRCPWDCVAEAIRRFEEEAVANWRDEDWRRELAQGVIDSIASPESITRTIVP